MLQELSGISTNADIQVDAGERGEKFCNLTMDLRRELGKWAHNLAVKTHLKFVLSVRLSVFDLIDVAFVLVL